MNILGFDYFMIAFTVLLIIAFVRSLKNNLFIKGFAGVALLIFLIMDFIMITGWFKKG